MTILGEIAPFAIACFVGWAGWLTKAMIDQRACNERRDQKLDDFISRYNEHLDKENG